MKKILILLLVSIVSLNMAAQKSTLVVGEVDAGSGVNSNGQKHYAATLFQGSPLLHVW